jgi:hypothetical protein
MMLNAYAEGRYAECIFMLSVTIKFIIAECHYSECHYAECRGAHNFI